MKKQSLHLIFRKVYSSFPISPPRDAFEYDESFLNPIGVPYKLTIPHMQRWQVEKWNKDWQRFCQEHGQDLNTALHKHLLEDVFKRGQHVFIQDVGVFNKVEATTGWCRLLHQRLEPTPNHQWLTLYGDHDVVHVDLAAAKFGIFHRHYVENFPNLLFKSEHWKNHLFKFS